MCGAVAEDHPHAAPAAVLGFGIDRRVGDGDRTAPQDAARDDEAAVLMREIPAVARGTLRFRWLSIGITAIFYAERTTRKMSRARYATHVVGYSCSGVLNGNRASCVGSTSRFSLRRIVIGIATKTMPIVAGS